MVLIEDFEDQDLSDWTNFGDSLDTNNTLVYEGQYAGRALNQNTNGPLARKSISSPEQIREFQYFYNIDPNSEGSGIRLLNSNGDFIIGLADDNPDWKIHGANGVTQLDNNGADNGVWVKVLVDFNWDNQTATVTYENTDTGYSDSATVDLINGGEFESVQLESYRFQEFQSAFTTDTNYDNISYLREFKGDDSDGVYDVGSFDNATFNNVTRSERSDLDSSTLSSIFVNTTEQLNTVAETALELSKLFNEVVTLQDGVQVTFGPLSGQVTLNESGVQGADVYAYNNTDGEFLGKTTTDENGGYRFNLEYDGDEILVAVDFDNSYGSEKSIIVDG